MHINTHTESLTKTNRFRSGRVGKGSMVCSGGSSAFLQGHNMQKPQSTTHKLNKHDFCASHKQDKNDFWPGCQTLRLAASHNWLSRLAARPCGWQAATTDLAGLAARPCGWHPATYWLSRLAARPCGWQAATTDLAGWLPDLAAGIQPQMT